MEYGDTLFERLKEHDAKNMVPFHMPGHKRNREKMPDVNPYAIDITEIDGFDDLHHPAGCIARAEEAAARLYGSRGTYFLINGATCGILAAISACAAGDGSMLLARNSHKSAYNAVLVNRLAPVYVLPRGDGTVSAEDVRAALKEHKDVSCVFITSPTYEGFVSDIEGIAQAAHACGIPLIVDEAHGAHMAFSDIFPKSAAQLGADVVIHGIHKTLPSLTQTALLHVFGDIVDMAALEKYLEIYQSSSPSYVLMGAIDYCVSYLAAEGERDFAAYADNLRYVYGRLETLKNLYALPYGENRDASKITICAGRAGISGSECYALLREKYNIQPEMASFGHVVLMTSVWDGREAYEKLADALEDIDGSCIEGDETGFMEGEECLRGLMESGHEYVMAPYEASVSETETVELSQAAGKVSADMIYAYPPGIPFAVPGERISEDMARLALLYRKCGFELRGMADGRGMKIRVCKNV